MLRVNFLTSFFFLFVLGGFLCFSTLISFFIYISFLFFFLFDSSVSFFPIADCISATRLARGGDDDRHMVKLRRVLYQHYDLIGGGWDFARFTCWEGQIAGRLAASGHEA